MTTQRLTAPSAGWSRETDVVVVGSGVAGLSAALHARRSGRVLLVTKTFVDAGSTRWAQGGIAAALAPEDSPNEHLHDTLVAGVGICDPAAVRVLVEEGPQRVRELLGLGARFDTDDDGELAFGREGGHHRDRIIHAGGDATGLEVQRALVESVRNDPGIEVIENALVLDLLRGGNGQAVGLTLHVLGEGSRDGVGAVLARAVVLATGGMGQIFASTTNPPVSTGDGVALALRAGARVSDIEFVQFHPTALWLGADKTGQQPLISEAMRGEGAFLIDADGNRVIDAATHPLADLAPRDVVAKAITRRMREQFTDHVFLDARHLGEETLLNRFPTIVASCRSFGIDPVTQPIPVAPAAHYASGGVRTDLFGRTDVDGLFACGEVACTGVHGANRLASNSLLEGLVFASRIGHVLAEDLPPQADPLESDQVVVPLVGELSRTEVTTAMSEGAAVLRSEDSLMRTAHAIDKADLDDGEVGPGSWESTAIRTIASVLLVAAAARQETRGCHWREDFPSLDDDWRGHLVTGLEESGDYVTRFEEQP